MAPPVETDAIVLGFALLVLGGLPLLSTGEETVRRVLEEAGDRKALYLSAAISLALLAGATWAVGTWRDLPAASLGWRGGELATGLVWGGGAAAVGLVGSRIGTRLLRAVGLEDTDVVLLILPRTAGEKAAFLALVLIGALCEEYVFRGYVLHVIERWAAPTGAGTAIAVGASSISFGLAHGYQRAAGVLRATGLGLVLAVPVVATGSLFPAVAAHFWINAVIGLGGWKWLLEET